MLAVFFFGYCFRVRATHHIDGLGGVSSFIAHNCNAQTLVSIVECDARFLLRTKLCVANVENPYCYEWLTEHPVTPAVSQKPAFYPNAPMQFTSPKLTIVLIQRHKAVKWAKTWCAEHPDENVWEHGRFHGKCKQANNPMGGAIDLLVSVIVAADPAAAYPAISASFCFCRAASAALVERQGQLRRRIVADVTAATIQGAIREEVDSRARLMTDEYSAYRGLKKTWEGGLETVCHGTKEYARGDVHVNTAESSHALIKRGLVGIYHNVSREYLHRYLWQFDFMWNNRKLNDGERTIAAIQAAEGKRLMYRPPITRDVSGN